MIVNSVRLRNFKSHADTSIGFGTGINVILGRTAPERRAFWKRYRSPSSRSMEGTWIISS